MATRRLIASLLAPVAGVVTACLGFVATGAILLDGGASTLDWPAVSAHWLGFYLFFGLPLDYVAEGLAIVSYRAFGADGDPGLGVVTSIAAASGGALVCAVWAAVFGARFGLMMLPSGGVGGAVAGIAFWAIGLRAIRRAPAV